MNRLQRTAARVLGIETRDSSYTDALVSRYHSQHASGEIDGPRERYRRPRGLCWPHRSGLRGCLRNQYSSGRGRHLTGRFSRCWGGLSIRKGELVVYITTTPNGGELLLLPAESHDVAGDPDPASWKYRLTLGGPARSHTLDSVSAASVLHFKYASDPDGALARPWAAPGCQARGPSIGQFGSLPGRRGERLPRGFLLPIPVEGGRRYPRATTELSWGGSRGRVALGRRGAIGELPRRFETATDWSTRRLGPNPPLALIELHRLATEEVAISCGINPSLLSGRQGTVAREGYRQLIVQHRRAHRKTRAGGVGGQTRS